VTGERGGNLRRAGVIGILLAALLVLAVQRLDVLLALGSGDGQVVAYFTDSSGLEQGDRVEVAGIAVGRVTEVAVDGPRIRVEARLDQQVNLGAGTGAAIKVGNLLGSKYLELLPRGDGQLSGAIPLDRTDPAYDVVEAVSDLTGTVHDIDTTRLGRALQVVANTFDGAGPDVRRAVAGLSDLSRTIAGRDDALRKLFADTETVVSSLDGSRHDLSRFVRSASLLLDEVDRQRHTIHLLIGHTTQLSEQLHGLVVDNQQDISPALRNLEKVTALLQARQDKLRDTVHNLATFSRVFIDTIGSGPWFDSYIANAPDTVSTNGAPR
jgi:phospholipid/cholesterol/gamma-HCH transport system substrate-binding protein